MKWNKLIISAVGISLLLGLGFLLLNVFSSMGKSPAKQPVATQEKFVSVVPVQYRAEKTRVSAYGRVTSSEQMNLTAEVQGRIIAKAGFLREGQNFRKGQLLCRIDNTEAEANLKAQKSSFLKTIAEALPDLKIDFADRYATWDGFFQSIEIDKPLPALPEAESPKEKTFLAARGILNQYYNIESAQERLTKYNIYAPFSGSFAQVFMQPGSIANPGSPIAKLIRTDRLELSAPIPVSDVQWVNAGDKVTIYSEDGKVTWDGKIARIGDLVDANTQSVNLYISITPNKTTPVMEGLYLRAEAEGEVVKDVMEIPRRALFDGNKVFLVKDGELVEQTITLHKTNAQTALISGPAAGAMVVQEPPVNAQAGMKVKIIED